MNVAQQGPSKMPSSIRCVQHSRKIKFIFAGILIILIISFFLLMRSTAIDTKIFNGIYRNECCPDIIIDDGQFSYGERSMMISSYGTESDLIGYVHGHFSLSGVEKSDEKAIIHFSGSGANRAISFPIDGKNYTFKIAIDL